MPDATEVPATTGLVLAGGGVRGAYEAGALSVILPALEIRGERPTVVVGTSVGAINAAFLTGTAHLPAPEACELLVERWRRTHLGNVVQPLVPQLCWLVGRCLAGLLPFGAVGPTGLINPAPTAGYLRRTIDWPRLRDNLDAGGHRLAILATEVGRERAVVFCGGPGPLPRHYSHVLDYVPVTISEEHVRASAAIPVLFPPVHIDGPAAVRGWYSDGATRLNTPIKPALDLGVDRLVVISTAAIGPAEPAPVWNGHRRPNLGDGALNLVHSRLADPLIEDLRALGNINAFFAGLAPDAGLLGYRRTRGKGPYRQIPYMFVGPDHRGVLGALAEQVYAEHYRGRRALRHPELATFGRIFGARSPVHSDLFSYLFFAPEYIEALLDLGAADARAWLQAPPGPAQPWQLGPLDVLTMPRSGQK
jgi:NTE family protein